MNHWIRKGQPALLLAPMEGVTDAPMRALLTHRPGFTHCVTEFLRISQMVLPKKSFLKHAVELGAGSHTPGGIPVFFQLLGGHPERLALSALRAVELGAIGIDLNFGCPSPTVNGNDGGASILRYPHRVEDIVRAVRQMVPQHIPVSAKLRLGWDDPRDIYVNAERAAAGGASWITIHGRTKRQGYAPPAHWGPIGEVQKSLSIPVIANGEIWTLEDFLRCQETTGCEHFMVGRGALANPNLAPQIGFALGIFQEKQTSFPERGEWHQFLAKFLDLCGSSKNPKYALRRVKQWMRYVALKRDFPDFETLKRLEDPLQLPMVLNSLRFPAP